MIEEIKKIFVYYSEDLIDETFPRKVEFNLLRRYLHQLEWRELVSEEKQRARKSILKSIKKYMEEDGIASFTYENAVVGFYDAGQELIQVLTNKSKNEILILRLIILIKMDMESIDIDFTLHDKKVTPFFVYDNLRKELSVKGYYFDGMDRLIECVKILNQSEV